MITSIKLYGTENPFEKSDAIYRYGAFGWGHAALYSDWLENYPPQNWACQVIVEATPEFVQYTTYQDFLDSGAFWGVRYCALTYEKRNTIAAIAKGAVGLRYDANDGYKNPGVSFRCDGLVEYSYEAVGIDIISSDTWWSLTPKKQYDALYARSSGSVIEASITSPAANSKKHGTITIKAYVSDGNDGSGIERTQFYYYDSENSFYLIGTDAENADVSRESQVSWNTTTVTDGAYQIQAVAFDQAGSSLASSKVTIYVDNTEPTVTNTKP